MASELIVQTLKGPTSGANANKVIVPSGQTLDMSDGTFTPSSGQIIQVVNGERTAWTGAVSGGSLIDITLNATITPTSSSSNILVIVRLNGIYCPGTSNRLRVELLRGGSSIAYLDDILTNNVDHYGASSSYTYLDSPSSTTSLTYGVGMFEINGNSFGVNNYSTGNNRTRSSVTLMEIAG